jgi:hypothetical protein
MDAFTTRLKHRQHRTVLTEKSRQPSPFPKLDFVLTMLLLCGKLAE